MSHSFLKKERNHYFICPTHCQDIYYIYCTPINIGRVLNTMMSCLYSDTLYINIRKGRGELIDKFDLIGLMKAGKFVFLTDSVGVVNTLRIFCSLIAK